MTIDNEVAVGRLLVLANAGFDQRSILHPGEAEAEVVTRALQALVADAPITAGGIKRGAARVVCKLEAAPLIAGNSVHEGLAVVGPDGHLGFVEAYFTGRWAEEKHILLRRKNFWPDRLGKEFAHPRAAREYKTICAQLGA